MKSITFFTALAAVVTAAFGLTINTPVSVVECQPTQLSWSGGTAPYYVAVVPAGQPSATPFESFPTQNGTSYTWTVDLGSGTSFTISLKDSTGATAYSDIVTVQGGTSTSCANTSVGSGAASTGGSGSSAAGSTATGTSAAAASGGSGSSATTAASSSSTSTQSGAAGRLSVSPAFGVAGLMGLVGAALF